MSYWRVILWAVLLVCLPALVSAQSNPVKTIKDADIVGTVSFWADTTYLLDGLVFVDTLETLNIEAGTVIKGKEVPTSGLASALVVARGGKIYAEGSPTQPIIFTAEVDDVTDPTDMPLDARGKWGGVIILGRAGINPAGGVNNIEGIDATTEPRGRFGGGANPDDNDNSGVFRFVSIRHGGTIIGANNEINGLSLGGVGRGTLIEFVEVALNADDGFEFFGGTVNTRYLVSVLNDDDSFDYDEGYRGNNQFWFSIQDSTVGDHAGEHDGGTTPEDGQPYAIPTIANATYIGSGPNTSKVNNAMILRDNAGGKYYNSVFTGFKGKFLTIQADTKARLVARDIDFHNNLLYGFSVGDSIQALATDSLTRAFLSDAQYGFRITNPQLRSISRINDGKLDPRPKGGSPVFSSVFEIPKSLNPIVLPKGTSAFDASRFRSPGQGFLIQTNYAGAFSEDDLWIEGWTYLSDLGYTRKQADDRPVKTLTDASIVGTVSLWADTTYLLDGLVFVDSLEILNIEAGTVIKGKEVPTSGLASALVVARGGKIYAEGTPNNPIIFTAEVDDVTDPTDMPLDARGKWGGVIILGRAGINPANGVNNIEGIDATTEPRGRFGGGANPDDNDNSGVFRFVSIRHGGTIIGANNEINGLSLGGVGRGTVVEFVEVALNADDGFEFFGGTVNTRYLISAFNDDDSFDYDEGYRGNNQFWFSIQDSTVGDHAGEHDGGTTPEDGLPYAIPTIANATYIGSGPNTTKVNNAMILRDNAGGKYYNSVFTGFKGKFLTIQADTQARLVAGDIDFHNNLLYGFSVGDSIQALATDSLTRAFLSDAKYGFRITNPQLRGISRRPDGKLDPRLAPASPARDQSKLFRTPEGPRFFVDVPYAGAFGDVNWAADWTYLSAIGYITPAGAGIPVAGLVGQPLPKTEALASDTSRVNFVNEDGSETEVKFNSGSVRGANVTFQPMGRTAPSLPGGVPAGKPGFYFDILSTIPDSVTFSAVIKVKYTQAQLDSAQITNESLIKLFRYNSADSTWQQLATTVDTLANIASATTGRFSTWSLVGTTPNVVLDDQHTSSTPKVFSLAQNRPNPFNPTTQISFTVPTTSHVRLTVFNLLGQKVETLVDGIRAPGSYTITWDARHVASGLYFYRIETSSEGGPSQVLSKKMTLLK